MVAVVTLAVGAVFTATVSDDSSVIKPHEMMVRLKHEIRIMFKIFFILSSKANVQEIADSNSGVDQVGRAGLRALYHGIFGGGYGGNGDAGSWRRGVYCSVR